MTNSVHVLYWTVAWCILLRYEEHNETIVGLVIVQHTVLVSGIDVLRNISF